MKISSPNLHRMFIAMKTSLNILSSFYWTVPLERTLQLTTTLVSVAKVGDRGQKSRKKRAKVLGRSHHPDIPAFLDQDPDLTWGRDVFLCD